MAEWQNANKSGPTTCSLFYIKHVLYILNIHCLVLDSSVCMLRICHMLSLVNITADFTLKTRIKFGKCTRPPSGDLKLKKDEDIP